jgi:hypothetical protein
MGKEKSSDTPSQLSGLPQIRFQMVPSSQRNSFRMVYKNPFGGTNKRPMTNSDIVFFNEFYHHF